MPQKLGPVVLLSCIAAVFVTGCTALPRATSEQVAAAQVGEPPKDAEDQIKKAMYTVLIDPTSPLYEFEPPHKDYSNRTGVIIYGWRVDFRANSKNRMGGYTGWNDYSAFFADGRLSHISRTAKGTDVHVFIYPPQ